MLASAVVIECLMSLIVCKVRLTDLDKSVVNIYVGRSLDFRKLLFQDS